MTDQVIIVGAGGHARVVADIVRMQGRKVLGFLDDDVELYENNTSWLGLTDDVKKFSNRAVFLIGLGSNRVRESYVERYSKELRFTTAIHPSSVIACDVQIGEGSVVMAGAVINQGSRIGNHCIVNTVSSVDHDCTLGNYVHVSPGAHIAGSVQIGKRSWIGIGGSIINDITIGNDVTIGAGGVVIQSILQSGVYVGVPVRRIGMLP